MEHNKYPAPMEDINRKMHTGSSRGPPPLKANSIVPFLNVVEAGDNNWPPKANTFQLSRYCGDRGVENISTKNTLQYNV